VALWLQIGCWKIPVSEIWCVFPRILADFRSNNVLIIEAGNLMSFDLIGNLLDST
jgi:hypothetical protein